jgi:hypothetical protein
VCLNVNVEPAWIETSRVPDAHQVRTP